MNRQELAYFSPSGSSLHTRGMAALLKPGRDVAMLAGIQILCFLALTRLEPRFFIIHFYQLIPFVALLLLVAYGRERWAYMIGPLVSLVWLSLAYIAGLLGSAVERLRSFDSPSRDTDFVALLAIVTAIVALLMIVLCRIHWVKQNLGRGEAWRTFLVSLAIVVAYYAILLRWFWDMIPNA